MCVCVYTCIYICVCIYFSTFCSFPSSFQFNCYLQHINIPKVPENSWTNLTLSFIDSTHIHWICETILVRCQSLWTFQAHHFHIFCSCCFLLNFSIPNVPTPYILMLLSITDFMVILKYFYFTKAFQIIIFLYMVFIAM